MLPNDSFRPLYLGLLTNIHLWLANIHARNVSIWHSRSDNIKNKMEIHWHILFNVFLVILFLLVSIVLTVIKTIWVSFFYLHVGRINPRSFGAKLTSHCSGVSGSSARLCSSMSASLSASQCYSLSFGLSKSQFQSSQYLASEMLSGAPF